MSDSIPTAWTEREATPLDFIVVGGGAGGAPLAARLVERGFQVAVIEMGPCKPDRPSNSVVENTEVPLLHSETTEDDRHSLRFFVKHFDTDPEHSLDPKVHNGDIFSRPGVAPQDDAGVFYPRAQGIGGCTIHNAMITIAGPPDDWDDIAAWVKDPSWSGEAMRGYFERLERCHYDTPRSWLGRLKRCLGFPDGWDSGRHGHHGWLDTTMTSTRFLRREKNFFKVVLSAAVTSFESSTDHLAEWLRPVLKGRPFPELDPNHWRVLRRSQEGLAQIPLAISPEGRRSSPRTRVLDAREKYPERLHLCTGALVMKLLFAERDAASHDSATPSVCGVQVYPHAHAYQADPKYENRVQTISDQECVNVYCRREVILCGGAFNTPQLLMLSGIGPSEELRRNEINIIKPLDGVGENLQDRYEVPVVATLTDRFRSLDGFMLTSRLPHAADDLDLKRWIEQIGDPLENQYSTNGGLIGYFLRSQQEQTIPDLFLFAIAGRFPGYHVGWSEPSRLAPSVGGAQQVANVPLTNQYNHGQQLSDVPAAVHKRSVTWLVLKGRTRNRSGTVRLRSNDPRRRPEINFRSFADGTDAGANADLEAIFEGVERVKQILNDCVTRGVVESFELPGLDQFSGDQRRWIRHVAWGHHACGTCKMGPSSDPRAVVNSRLQVHGVNNLRIVDASIFPKIPGYFLVTSIYMVSEKAADMLSEDHADNAQPTAEAPVWSSRAETRRREAYPIEMEHAEAECIRRRRQTAGVSP